MSKPRPPLHHAGVELRSRARVDEPPGAAEPLLPLRELTADDLVRLGQARTAARRERRYAAVGLAVLVLIGAVALAVARGEGRDTRVTSASPGSTTTTVPAATSTTAPVAAGGAPAGTAAPDTAPVTSTTAPAGTTTTAPAGTRTTATSRPASTTGPTAAPATTVTTAPAPACRNSTDPACGPFRFDTQPQADRPMTLRLTAEPPAPPAGSPIELRAELTDPDGVGYNAWSVDFGDGGLLGASGTATCDKFGPWDPPAPNPDAAVEVRTFSHTYQAPGTYTVRMSFEPGPFNCVDAVTGVGDRPYASPARAEITVVVVPAP